MLIDHAGGGGLTSATSVPVSPSEVLPSRTSANPDGVHSTHNRAHGNNVLPAATDVEEEEKPLSFDEMLDSVFQKFLSSTDVANELARQNAVNAQNFEAEQARIAYERAKELEDTYYQRRVRDLEAAGLNKWMAVYGNMSGSTSVNPSTPSGHVADTFRKNDSGITDFISMVPVILKLAEALWNQITSSFNRPYSYGTGDNDLFKDQNEVGQSVWDSLFPSLSWNKAKSEGRHVI